MDLETPKMLFFPIYHTMYKNHFVRVIWAMCGCVRVCDMSLEPSRPTNEHMMDARAPAGAVRPQCVKMCFLLHKAALNGLFEASIANEL